MAGEMHWIVYFADASGTFRPFASVAGTVSEHGSVRAQRTLPLLDSWIANMEPFICLVGPEGCGKSMTINEHVSIATLHCNAQTPSDRCGDQ